MGRLVRNSGDLTKDKDFPFYTHMTQVDAEGVLTEKGNCDDERNTAYDGPDADNTCKMPFFWDGRWYENCTLYPRDDYWCATKINPDTREMLDGECHKHLRYPIIILTYF